MVSKKQCYFLLTAALGLCGMTTGCDDESATPPMCEIGALRECPCDEGGTGIQECVQDGSRWGACQGCEEEISESDCSGDSCVDEADCCDGFACASWIFYGDEYEENYCYPICDIENEDAPCFEDEMCLDFDGLPLCLMTGSFQMDSIAYAVGPDRENSAYIEIGSADYDAEHGGDRIDFAGVELFYSEEYNDITIMVEGMAGISSVWILYIIIPEEIYSQGPGTYPALIDNTLVFSADLYYGNLDEEYYFEELWLESVLDYENSTLTIGQLCEPCPVESLETANEDCEQCEFGFDLSWFNVRTKITLD